MKTYILYSRAKGVEGIPLSRIYAKSEEDALTQAVATVGPEDKVYVKEYWFVRQEK